MVTYIAGDNYQVKTIETSYSINVLYKDYSNYDIDNKHIHKQIYISGKYKDSYTKEQRREYNKNYYRNGVTKL